MITIFVSFEPSTSFVFLSAGGQVSGQTTYLIRGAVIQYNSDQRQFEFSTFWHNVYLAYICQLPQGRSVSYAVFFHE